MGQLAQRLMAKAAEVIITKDVDLALQLEQDDDEMDLLHRTLFQHLMDDRWKHGIETAVDVTLLGRYYERFADHAVVGRQARGVPGDGRARGRPPDGRAAGDPGGDGGGERLSRGSTGSGWDRGWAGDRPGRRAQASVRR